MTSKRQTPIYMIRFAHMAQTWNSVLEDSTDHSPDSPFSSSYDDSAYMPTFDPSDPLESSKTHLNTKILIHKKIISKYFVESLQYLDVLTVYQLNMLPT